jgi:hypothetical protein
MTLTEYAQEVGAELRVAYNAKDREAVQSLIQSADATLIRSDIAEQQKRFFWSEVQRIFLGGRIIVEKQANSSLHALMRDIEAALAARQTGK